MRLHAVADACEDCTSSLEGACWKMAQPGLHRSNMQTWGCTAASTLASSASRLMGQQNTRQPSAARRAECSLRRAGLRRSCFSSAVGEAVLLQLSTNAKFGQLAAKQVSKSATTSTVRCDRRGAGYWR